MKKILLLVLSFSSIAWAQQDKYRKIDSLLTFLNANNKFMGSLAIRQNGKPVFDKAYGLADTENWKKLDSNTKLKIGSVTKTFTATLIMQLVEEGKLTLDTKLSKFYPKIPNAEKITIYHLMHNRSGIPDFLNDDPNVAQFIYGENKREDVIKRIAAYTPAFEPGSQYKYSNSNFNLLGYIVEDITKKSYAENISTRIAKKIGLKNTYYPLKINAANNEGYSHTFDGKKWDKTGEWSSDLAFSAGALSSTSGDLTLFMEALLEGRLVSKASVDQMKTMVDGYGMGLIIAPFDGRKFYGHTGGIENFRSAAAYNPDDKTAIAIIINGDNYDRNDIMIGVLSLYYDQAYNFPDLKGFAVSEAILNSYAGTYSAPGFPMKIMISQEKGTLIAQATGQGSFALVARSETEFIFDPAHILLKFSEGKMLLNQGGNKTEFTKE